MLGLFYVPQCLPHIYAEFRAFSFLGRCSSLKSWLSTSVCPGRCYAFRSRCASHDVALHDQHPSPSAYQTVLSAQHRYTFIPRHLLTFAMATGSFPPVTRSASEDVSQSPAAIETENGVEAPPPSPVEQPRQFDTSPVEADTDIATPEDATLPRALAHDNKGRVHSKLASSRYNSSHSIANAPSYPRDGKQDTVLNHRRNAFAIGDTTAQPTSLQSAPRNASPKPASGHRRGISSTADFAYPPGDSGHTIRSPSEEEELAQFSRDANNTSLISRQTTAVNTTRNSSDTSADEVLLDHLVDNLDPALYENLRGVVAAAQPGVKVHFTLNVHHGNVPSRQRRVNEPRETKKQEGHSQTIWEHLIMEVRDVLEFM
jgi:hypothetical protein